MSLTINLEGDISFSVTDHLSYKDRDSFKYNQPSESQVMQGELVEDRLSNFGGNYLIRETQSSEQVIHPSEAQQ